GRHLRHETFSVKLSQLIPTRTAGQYRYVIDVSVFHHGGECFFSVTRRELVLHMFFPQITQTLLRSGPTLVYARLLRFVHGLPPPFGFNSTWQQDFKRATRRCEAA